MQITRALRYAGAKEQPSPVRDDDGFAAVPCLLDEVYDRYMEYFAKDCLYAVSYTHLDVYKRQAHGNLQSGGRI